MIPLAVTLAATLALATPGSHRALVERYEDGDRAALDALWRLDRDVVKAEVLWLRKLAARRRTTREEAFYHAYPFTAAVRAHTELYLRAQLAEDQGEIGHQEEYARGLLEAARERLPPLGGRWHLYLAVHHLERLELEIAERFAEDGTRAHPHDARLWLAAGAISQAAARFAPQRPWRLPASPTEQVRPRTGAAADRRALLHEAERQLARGLQLDPMLHEAGLRLAQAREALGDVEGALQALGGVPEELDGVLAYVAWLQRGRLHARRGRAVEAIRAYRRAAARMPGAETAWLALAHALEGVGEARDAEAALDQVLAGDDVHAARDPFRMFPIFCAGGARSLWDEMSAGAR